MTARAVGVAAPGCSGDEGDSRRRHLVEKDGWLVGPAARIGEIGRGRDERDDPAVGADRRVVTGAVRPAVILSPRDAAGGVAPDIVQEDLAFARRRRGWLRPARRVELRGR